MRGRRGDRERLFDILEAIDAIRQYITSREQLQQPLSAAAATHWIEIIGEAARGVSSEVRQAHSDIPWQNAVRMRNRLIHGYFDIDLDLVWDTIQQDLPTLQDQVQAVLVRLDD